MPQLFFCREKHEKPLAFIFTFSEVIREFQALPWLLVRGDMVFFWWGVHAWGREVAEDGERKNTFLAGDQRPPQFHAGTISGVWTYTTGIRVKLWGMSWDRRC